MFLLYYFLCKHYHYKLNLMLIIYMGLETHVAPTFSAKQFFYLKTTICFKSTINKFPVNIYKGCK